MYILKNLILIISVTFIFTACSHKAQEYRTDVNISNILNDYELSQAKTSKLSSSGEGFDTIQLRGLSMTSPYGSNFEDYLAESLKKQLSQNSLFNEESNINIKTKLLKNDSDIWGFSSANFTLEAQFFIEKNGQVIYDEKKTIIHTFPSHFVGQIAIENGINNYPKAIQKLISAFLTDLKVLELLKKSN